jgi:hypothetical protein
VEKVDPRDAAAYDRIRNDIGDTARIAENTRIPRGKLDQIKDHIFIEEHDIQTGPNQISRGNFTPLPHVADLWSKAGSGVLNSEQAEDFHRLMAHEYVESRLMSSGMPFRSPHPDAWDSEGTNVSTPEHYGAHDLAPLTSGVGEPFGHWERALNRTKPDVTEISPDLSNLDNVVDQILLEASDD